MKRLLLDTHAFLWWAMDDPRLSRAACAAISQPDNDCFLSTASTWEMAIKASLGKLEVAGDLQRFVRQQMSANRFRLLTVELPHSLRVAELPWHHRDPFDRLLVAQCQLESLTLLSADDQLHAYDVPVLW